MRISIISDPDYYLSVYIIADSIICHKLEIQFLSELNLLSLLYILKLKYAHSRGNLSYVVGRERIDFANIYSGFAMIFRN